MTAGTALGRSLSPAATPLCTDAWPAWSPRAVMGHQPAGTGSGGSGDTGGLQQRVGGWCSLRWGLSLGSPPHAGALRKCCSPGDAGVPVALSRGHAGEGVRSVGQGHAGSPGGVTEKLKEERKWRSKEPAKQGDKTSTPDIRIKQQLG